MNNVVRHFFLSYSHGDNDKYLDRFVKDLRKHVSLLVNADEDDVGFRDVDNIKDGEDWKTAISANARRSHALVCIYSARFFDKNREREYCAKEFAVFLKRNKEVRYEPNNGGGQFRGAHHIFPVLWVGEKDLEKSTPPLPPYAVKSIQYTSDNSDYRDNGLLWMMMKRRAGYVDLLIDLARLIRDCSRKPLDPLEEEIDIDKLRNAFWEPPEGTPLGPTVPAAAERARYVAAALPPGPRHMLAFEVRILSANVPVWSPYRDEPSFPALVADVALTSGLKLGFKIVTVDPTVEGFAEDVSAALAIATEKQIIPIAFVHPDCLGRKDCRNKLKKVLENKWRGGLIIPADESDAEAVSLVEKYWDGLERSRNAEEPAVIRRAIGRAATFQTAAASIAHAILTLIQQKGVVQHVHPNNEGLVAVPRFANTSDAALGQ